MCVTAGIPHQLACEIHVRGISRERHGNVVDALATRELDVLAILIRQRWRGDATALEVDALAVRELATGDHLRVDARARNLRDFELDETVVEQQNVAGL